MHKTKIAFRLEPSNEDQENQMNTVNIKDSMSQTEKWFDAISPSSSKSDILSSSFTAGWIYGKTDLLMSYFSCCAYMQRCTKRICRLWPLFLKNYSFLLTMSFRPSICIFQVTRDIDLFELAGERAPDPGLTLTLLRAPSLTPWLSLSRSTTSKVLALNSERKRKGNLKLRPPCCLLKSCILYGYHEWAFSNDVIFCSVIRLSTETELKLSYLRIFISLSGTMLSWVLEVRQKNYQWLMTVLNKISTRQFLLLRKDGIPTGMSTYHITFCWVSKICFNMALSLLPLWLFLPFSDLVLDDSEGHPVTSGYSNLSLTSPKPHSNLTTPDREACEEDETMGTTTLRGEDLFDDTSEADEQYELAPEDHPGGSSSNQPSVILNKGRIRRNIFYNFSRFWLEIKFVS